jgi:hypothetical protein
MKRFLQIAMDEHPAQNAALVAVQGVTTKLARSLQDNRDGTLFDEL